MRAQYFEDGPIVIQWDFQVDLCGLFRRLTIGPIVTQSAVHTTTVQQQRVWPVSCWWWWVMLRLIWTVCQDLPKNVGNW